MREKTTNPNGRSNEIEVRRSTADDRLISEDLLKFFGDKKYFQFRGVTAQVTPDGIRVKVDETKTVNIGSDNFVGSPVTPLKEAQTTQVKRSTSASKNVKSTSGEEGYRNGTSLEEQGGTSLEKQDGSKGNNPMSKQNPQNPTNHRRGKRPTSTLNSRTSNKSGKAKNVEGER